MTTLRWFSLLLVVFLLSRCSTDARQEMAEATIVDQNGSFRGYQMGAHPDSILAHEEWLPSFKSDTLIEYQESVFYLGDTTDLLLFLAFDELGLFEIQADFYTRSRPQREAIDSSFSVSLTDAFGSSDQLGEEKRWTTFSARNNTVEITLSHEIDSEGEPFISLNYLEPLDDKY